MGLLFREDLKMIDKQYMKNLVRILDDGITSEYRNGNRISLFDVNMEFDTRKGCPVLSIKKTNWDAAFREMLWFLSGSTNTKDLVRIGAPNIWKAWEDVDGNIGPMYGHMLRHAPNNGVSLKSRCSGIIPKLENMCYAPDMVGLQDNKEEIDQLWYVIQNIKNNPASSRHRMTTFNPMFMPDESLIPKMNVIRDKGCLTPCHGMVIQFHVSGKFLDMKMVQSSGDWLIGVPFNVAQYAFLLELIARETGLISRYFHYNVIDAHVYENQLKSIDKLLKSGSRTKYTKPKIEIDSGWDMWKWKFDGIVLHDYNPDSFIKIPVS